MGNRMRHWSQMFKPAMLVLNRLRYSIKFGLIGLIFLIPITFMLVQYFNKLDEEIRFAEQERLGTELLQDLNVLITAVEKHRLTAAASIRGNKAATGQITEWQSQVDQVLAQLDQKNTSHRALLDVSDSLKPLMSQWNDLKSSAGSFNATDNEDKHMDMEKSIAKLVNEVKNESNLILDPQMDSYYLMDSTVNVMPYLWFSIGKAASLSGELLQRGNFNNTVEKEQMILSTGDISAYLDKLKDSTQISYQYNRASEEKLSAALKQAMEGVTFFNNSLYSNIVASFSFIMKTAELDELTAKAFDASGVLYQTELQQLDQQLVQRIHKAESSKVTLLAMTLLFILIAAYVFIAFYCSVKHTVDQLKETSALLSQGQLTARAPVDTKDELSQLVHAFNALADSFQHVVGESKQVAELVNTSSQQLSLASLESTRSSEQIARTIQEVATGSELQMHTAQETSQAMQEMAAGVQRIAETSAFVSESANGAAADANHGHEVVSRAVEQMSSIKEKVEETAVTIRLLGDASSQINRIAEAQNAITKQTQLLALNASIEAARAGVHGRGFQVVAAEVKKLAEESEASGKQIVQLIRMIQDRSQEAVEKMEVGVKEVDKGTDTIERSGEVFGRILGSIQQVAEQIQEISAASQQMSAGSQQVTASMEETVLISRNAAAHAQEVASATQQQLASMEEIAASAESLNERSDKLHHVLKYYTV
ncbi:methyl-accepting chemotaxis protein [Paenibacillus rigui]|nr:HAMP domain-containing methyl-accepting chemotaxis protein [Paenibacillus rigui]